MFFVMFNVMGVATQKLGLPAVSVAGKMSLIIPVISSYLFLDGNLEFIGWIGILIGIVSIFLTLYTDNFKISKLAIILFIGSGLLDSLLATKITLAPCNKNSFAVASPIPEEAPVTMTVFPLKYDIQGI